MNTPHVNPPTKTPHAEALLRLVNWFDQMPDGLQHRAEEGLFNAFEDAIQTLTALAVQERSHATQTSENKAYAELEDGNRSDVLTKWISDAKR